MFAGSSFQVIRYVAIIELETKALKRPICVKMQYSIIMLILLILLNVSKNHVLLPEKHAIAC